MYLGAAVEIVSFRLACRISRRSGGTRGMVAIIDDMLLNLYNHHYRQGGSYAPAEVVGQGGSSRPTTLLDMIQEV